MTRLRLGVLLIALSWFPFAQIFLVVAHNHNLLMSDQASQLFRLGVWAMQIVIGLIGVWLAGKTAVAEAKREGWKKTPAHLWRLIIHGQAEDSELKR